MKVNLALEHFYNDLRRLKGEFKMALTTVSISQILNSCTMMVMNLQNYEYYQLTDTIEQFMEYRGTQLQHADNRLESAFAIPFDPDATTYGVSPSESVSYRNFGLVRTRN